MYVRAGNLQVFQARLKDQAGAEINLQVINPELIITDGTITKTYSMGAGIAASDDNEVAVTIQPNDLPVGEYDYHFRVNGNQDIVAGVCTVGDMYNAMPGAITNNEYFDIQVLVPFSGVGFTAAELQTALTNSYSTI